MMNEKYKEAFSSVCPSENSIERIFDMTKNRKTILRPFLIAAIITVLFAVSLVSANAATDGALAETAVRIAQSVKIFIDGEEANPEDINFTHSSEVVSGENIDTYYFELGEEGTDGYISFDVSDDGVEIGAGGFESVTDESGQINFKATVTDENGKEIELNVPTTRALNE